VFIEEQEVGAFARHNLSTIDHSPPGQSGGAIETKGTLSEFTPNPSRFDADPAVSVRLSYRSRGARYVTEGLLTHGAQFMGNEPQKQSA